MPHRVAVFVGSLRAASWNRRIAQALIALAPPALSLELVEIGDLPLYDQDLEEEGSEAPQAWLDFRGRVRGFDAVLFVTPEYNRSVPAALKNAIDVGSRPFGQSVWDGKPGAIISASPGPMGAFGANHHLRQSLVFLNVPCLQMPEMYLGRIAERFDVEGNLADPRTRELLERFLTTYAEWVARNVRSEAR